MTAQVGDIVAVTTGTKYVVLEFSGNPVGGTNARLIRPDGKGRYVGFTNDALGLTVIQSPSFQQGEQVLVDGLKGGVLSIQDGIARVLLAERRKQTKSGDYIDLSAAVARVPVALLVLENRPF